MNCDIHLRLAWWEWHYSLGSWTGKGRAQRTFRALASEAAWREIGEQVWAIQEGFA